LPGRICAGERPRHDGCYVLLLGIIVGPRLPAVQLLSHLDVPI